MLAREPESFLRGERDSCRHSTTSFITNVAVAKFYHSAIGEGLSSFHEDNSANFPGESKVQ